MAPSPIATALELFQKIKFFYLHNVIVLIFSKAVVQMYPVEYGFSFMPIYFNTFQVNIL